jgi:hypothetical protein
MWLISILIFVLLPGWSAILWLVLPIDIFQYSLPAILAMHAVPPLLAIAAWLGGRSWHRRLRDRRCAADALALQQACAEEKSQKKAEFEAMLAARQAPVECRWIHIAASPWRGFASAPSSAHENIHIEFDAPSCPPQGDITQLRSMLSEMLSKLYLTAPMASCLPIAFTGSSCFAAAQLETVIRQARAAARTGLALDLLPQLQPDLIALSPREQSLHAAMLALFEGNPSWPAVLVLTFDSLEQTAAEGNAASVLPDGVRMRESEKWRGVPASALVAMLLTPHMLATALQGLAKISGADAITEMTPYWERERIPAGLGNFLASLPAARRHDFDALPVLGRLHAGRPVNLGASGFASDRIEMIRATLNEAAIDAGLLEPVFEWDGESISLGTPAMTVRQSAWLIHNAGDYAHAGNRMSQLAAALWQSGMEFDPVENGTNTATAIGDCGEAMPWLWQAMALQRAQHEQAPVVCAIFDDGPQPGVMTTNFAVPG